MKRMRSISRITTICDLVMAIILIFLCVVIGFITRANASVPADYLSDSIVKIVFNGVPMLATVGAFIHEPDFGLLLVLAVVFLFIEVGSIYNLIKAVQGYTSNI